MKVGEVRGESVWGCSWGGTVVGSFWSLGVEIRIQYSVYKSCLDVERKPRLYQVLNPDSNPDYNPHGEGGLSLDLNPDSNPDHNPHGDLDLNPDLNPDHNPHMGIWI